LSLRTTVTLVLAGQNAELAAAHDELYRSVVPPPAEKSVRATACSGSDSVSSVRDRVAGLLPARFAPQAIGGETLGLSLFTLAPGFRIPFATSTRPRKRSTSSSADPLG
jgi:hypothetical protein